VGLREIVGPSVLPQDAPLQGWPPQDAPLQGWPPQDAPLQGWPPQDATLQGCWTVLQPGGPQADTGTLSTQTSIIPSWAAHGLLEQRGGREVSPAITRDYQPYDESVHRPEVVQPTTCARLPCPQSQGTSGRLSVRVEHRGHRYHRVGEQPTCGLLAACRGEAERSRPMLWDSALCVPGNLGFSHGKGSNQGKASFEATTSRPHRTVRTSSHWPCLHTTPSFPPKSALLDDPLK
jgi:hypothetical protein